MAEKKIYSRILYVIVFCIAGRMSYGQHFTTLTFEATKTKTITPDSIYSISAATDFTGLVVKIDHRDSFGNSFLVFDADTFKLSVDEHGNSGDSLLFSNMVTCSVPRTSFLFYPDGIRFSIEFYLINSQSKAVRASTPNLKKKSVACSEPEMIDQAVWRAGLAEPDYLREVNMVHHNIVHHSAGSNTDSNYTNVVRNIYVYHTEIRGWSDIGYNYLIAQDGSIFKGRDPGLFEQDNVKGAHFCNSNAGTMGICVLGTYSGISPSAEVLQSLTDLLVWKTGKDSLNPLAISTHPLNNMLPAIAGHRDGCATECPGNNLYASLDSLRLSVSDGFSICGFEIKPLNAVESYKSEVMFYQKGHILKLVSPERLVKRIAIYSSLGKIIPYKIVSQFGEELEIELETEMSGCYILVIQTNNQTVSRKFVLYP